MMSYDFFQVSFFDTRNIYNKPNYRRNLTMNNLQESFERALEDFYAVNWSETDGSDVKQILETYFENIPNNRSAIQKLFDDYAKINKYQKMIASKMLEAC